jgi:hypothetical protein
MPVPIDLPGPIVLVPGGSLEGKWRQQRRDHPHLPAGLGQVGDDLREMHALDGAPATIAPPKAAGKDPSLLLYSRSYVLRLFASARRDAYIIAAIEPLRLTHHHDLAWGFLQLRPARWAVELELRRVPPGCSAYWPQIQSGWAGARGPVLPQQAPGRSPRQESFLSTLSRMIDADEKISAEAASARPFPYREVKSAAGRRSGISPIYEFVLAAEVPEEHTFVQVRGEPQQRGQVTRTAGMSATVRFDQPVDWDRIPRQGQLEETFSRVVYRTQRETVDQLRTGQARNPSVLAVMADYRTDRFRPASDEPTETLDEDQLRAFRRALTVPDLLIVLGPPGTGKTRTISQIARASAFGLDGDRQPGRVLVTSHTHRAVDNVLARLPADLLRIRVGHDGKVTAEGQPYLLETQAADLRERILTATSRALAAYADLGIARQWAEELGRRIITMNAAIAEEVQARSRLLEARRAVGGAAQTRVDALAAERDQQERELSHHAAQAERLTQRAVRVRAQGSWPLPGLLFGMLARRSEQRLARIQEAATALRAERDSTQRALAQAEQELDVVTRDDPAVQAASAMVSQCSDRRAERRDSALAAARTCRDLVARVDAPVFVAERSEAAEQDLPAFQAWLAQRLPLLEARAELLAEWHERASGATDQLYPELIRYADVVAATCIGAASRPELSGVEFDLAIVDEAGQIGAANVLVPLARARRGVLVGDHQQLPPYLDSEVEAWGAGVGDPAIRDLLAKSTLELLAGKLGDDHEVMLTQQRRMPAVIADFISAEFYERRLRTAVRREHRDPLFRSPLAFVDTSRLPPRERYEKSGRDRERWGQPGYTNPAEADLLTELAAQYDRQGAEWAVIVPYRAQAARITAALAPRIGNTQLARLNVGTVDSFQGGERDVILYGFTRSNPEGRVGFLSELRRANVAFTRAKYQLILAGDLSTLTMARDEGFRELARSLRSYLADHGDLRRYQDIRDLLDGSLDRGGLA